MDGNLHILFLFWAVVQYKSCFGVILNDMWLVQRIGKSLLNHWRLGSFQNTKHQEEPVSQLDHCVVWSGHHYSSYETVLVDRMLVDNHLRSNLDLIYDIVIQHLELLCLWLPSTWWYLNVMANTLRSTTLYTSDMVWSITLLNVCLTRLELPAPTLR